MKPKILGVLCALFFFSAAHASDRKTLLVVEDSWARIAREAVDPKVWKIETLLPRGFDPHDVDPTPKMARDLANADAILLNGGGYDDWALRFVPQNLRVSKVIIAGDYARISDPHYFLNPEIAGETIRALQARLKALDSDTTDENFLAFEAKLNRLEARIAQMKNANFARDPNGAGIAMIEPAGQALLTQAGYRVTDTDLAYDVMAGRGISARDQADLIRNIDERKIAFLVLNPDHAGTAEGYLENRAKKAGLRRVFISETAPEDLSWFSWIDDILNQTEG